MKKWQKLNETEFKAGYRRMLNRTFLLPNGKKDDFTIAKSGLVVCVFPLTKEDKVVMAKQFRPGPEKIFMELPGGGAEKGEDPKTAMERELLEETGYTGDIEFIGTCFDSAYSTMERHCFIPKNCHKIQEPQLDETEFVEVVEVPLDEFRKILRSGQMTDVEVGYLALDYLGFLK